MAEVAPEKKKKGSKIKGLFGELKKVTWPSFSKVVSQTGVVIAVTLFFLVVLMLMDVGLQELYKLLVSGLSSEGVSMVSGSFGKAAEGFGTAVSGFPLF